MAPIIVYGKEASPPCRMVYLVARALGVPYEMKLADPATGDTRTEEYTKINPARAIPSIDDNGFCLGESRAICRYLVNKYAKDDKWYPKDVQKRAMVDFMLDYDCGTLFPAFFLNFIPQLLHGAPENKHLIDNIHNRLKILDDMLSSRPFVAGDHITMADLSIISTLSFIEAGKFSRAEYPHIEQWTAKVKKEVPFYDEVARNGEEMIVALFEERLGSKKSH